MRTILAFASVFLSFNFAEAVSGADLEPLSNGAAFELSSDAKCGGVAKKSIFSHPPYKGAAGRVAGQFDIHLNDAKEPALCFFTGVRDGHGSDKGLVYRVFADGKELWSATCKDSVWTPASVSLKDYAGKAVVLELSVESLGEHLANWGEPKVVDGAKTLYDLADMAAAARKGVVLDKPSAAKAAKPDLAKDVAKALPSPQQLAWQEMEFIGFVHFGMNTFTGKEWGEGKEDPKLFNPTELDARQWAKTFKQAGIKMLIFTAKHHDGFCLWPSEYTEHSVKNSPWKGGKGDLVKEVSDACREEGIKFGVYLSPWDRNNPKYGDSPAYNEYFKSQLRELMTKYGKVTEVWFDGACGEGPNGKKQVYDFQSYYKVIRELQPEALIAICGPDIRWVGNEDGLAHETEWSAKDGKWRPSECDVSIRPGWFYHQDQDAKVKSLKNLLDIYDRSVGRNSQLLLNVPPDKRGLINEADVKRLMELRKSLDDTFALDFAKGRPASASSSAQGHGPEKAFDGDGSSYWAPGDGDKEPSLELSLDPASVFNRVVLQEFVQNGQKVAAFSVEAWNGSEWKPLASGTTIGRKRILEVPDASAAKIRLVVKESYGEPQIRAFSLYKAPPVQ